MIFPKFGAKLIEGKLKLENPERFKQYLSRFKPEEELQVVVSKWKRQRSNQQNRYYWGVVLFTIALETGHTEEELHEVFKRMFLPKKFVKWNEKEIAMPGSTTEQDTLAFNQYIEKIIIEAGTLGISIPTPDEFS